MEKNVPARTGIPAGNTATVWLKIIALAFMFIDHAGKMLFHDMTEMRMLGRIAFPIYIWCMIVGFHYTRSVWKYLLRILIIGLISQPLYNVALNHTWANPNIFLTLFLGLCAVWGISGRKDPTHALAPASAAAIGTVLWIYFGWLYTLVFCLLAMLLILICALLKGDAEKTAARILVPAAALILANVLNADYGWKGVLLFMLLYAVRDSRPGIAAVMIAYFLFWGSFYNVTRSFFGYTFDVKQLPGFLVQPVSSVMRLETYALLSLPFILIRFRKDLKMPRWAGYLLYPGHLILLYALEKIF